MFVLYFVCVRVIVCVCVCIGWEPNNVPCIYLIRTKTKRSFIKILRCIIRLYSYSYDSNTRENWRKRWRRWNRRKHEMLFQVKRKRNKKQRRRTYVLDFVPFSSTSLPVFRVFFFSLCFVLGVYHFKLFYYLIYFISGRFSPSLFLVVSSFKLYLLGLEVYSFSSYFGRLFFSSDSVCEVFCLSRGKTIILKGWKR